MGFLADHIEGSFEVVGDGGEEDLGRGFGDAAPSHSPKAIAPLPGAKYFLDPSPNAMDRPVPGIEAGEGLGFVVAPHRGRRDARFAAFRADGIAKMLSPIGAVGEDVARIGWQSAGAGLAVVHIGWSDDDFLDQGRFRIRSHMSLEAVHGVPVLVLDPARIVIPLAGRGNDRGIDERARLDGDGLGFQPAS